MNKALWWVRIRISILALDDTVWIYSWLSHFLFIFHFHFPLCISLSQFLFLFLFLILFFFLFNLFQFKKNTLNHLLEKHAQTRIQLHLYHHASTALNAFPNLAASKRHILRICCCGLFCSSIGYSHMCVPFAKITLLIIIMMMIIIMII